MVAVASKCVDVVIDFETRSRLSLDATNVYKYARHSSTEVLCMSYSIDGGPVQLWKPLPSIYGDKLLFDFPFVDLWPDCRIIAYNAEFELSIWKYICEPRYNWPMLSAEQLDCLMARSSYAGLPRGLGGVCSALGLGFAGKDEEGRANMLKLTKPVKVKGNPVKLVGCEYFGGVFDEDPKRHTRNEVYCRKDTKAELFVHGCVPELRPTERELWQVHRRINERGVPVDVDFCRNATLLVDREYTRLTARLAEITSRKDVTPDCNIWLKDWLRERGYPYHSLDQQSVEVSLGLVPGCEPPTLSDDCKEVLNIRRLCRDSAVSKYEGILNHAEADGRCRAAHVFYKAGPGRFAGAGVNFLNLRRMSEDDVPRCHELAERISLADEADLEDIYQELRAGEGVIPTLGGMVRAAVRARPGYKLVDIDFKSIEYRMLHWLAGDVRELKHIRDFDDGIGPESYVIAAASIFHKPISEVTKDERKIGKVQRLACGYLGGAGTFMTFCEAYGIPMTMELANEIVQNYRRGNPEVKSFWYEVGRKAIRAFETGGRASLRHVEYFMQGSTLNLRLPSGRCIKYYDPSVVDGDYGPEIEALCVDMAGQKKNMRVDVSNNKYYRVGLPLLVENMDQGASFDLLAGSLIRGDRAKLPIVLHVYDSIMMEVPENDEDCERVLNELMRETPAWATGLPLSTDLKVCRRMT